ncbi:MAG: hypothetical protein HC834_11190, partial [Rhodospirillales bacterium]|nr:hypothetical protein [Rhodospirillales bacterium]
RRLTLQLGARHYFVRGDEARLLQVLWNILKNALKFTPEGGIIRVISTNPDQHTLRVTVIDTGVGIAAERLESIFGVFEQGVEIIDQRLDLGRHRPREAARPARPDIEKFGMQPAKRS